MSSESYRVAVSFNTVPRSPPSAAIGGTVHPFASPIQDMGIGHRRADVLVPEQVLYCPNVIAVFDQTGAERMP
jgi:hypothetical protein